MTIQEQQLKTIEYAWGATVAEKEQFQCGDIPYFQRGRFLTEPPNKSEYIPQFRSVQVYEYTESNGVLAKSGLLYRPMGYDFIPFDIDAPDTVEAIIDARKLIRWLEKYGIFDYSIYWSGSKGIHITLPWSSFDKTYYDYTPMILKTLVTKYIGPLAKVATLDSSVYNNRSLFRLPNTRNVKTGFYKIPITRDELMFGDIGDIEILARHPREDFQDSTRGESDYRSINLMYDLSADVVQIAAERPYKLQSDSSVIESIEFVENFVEAAQLAPGTRHSVSLTLAAYFRARGLTQQETEDILIDFMTRCTGSNTPIAQRINESKNDVRACFTRDVRFSYYRAKDTLCG